MKNKLYLLGVLFILAACEQDFTELQYKDGSYVTFNTPTGSVSEGNTSTNTLSVVVSRNSPDITKDLTVTFGVASATFEGTGADASTTFTVAGVGTGATSTTVVIPANKTTATVMLTTKANVFSEKNRTIQIAITAISEGGLQIGYPGPSGIGKVFTATIVDDDCAFVTSKFTGAYNCVEPGYNNNNPYTVTFTSNAANTIIADNFWDSNIAIVYDLDPLTNTVSIAPQAFGGSYSVSGTGGTLETCTGKMIAPYVVTGPNPDTNTHTYTRK